MRLRRVLLTVHRWLGLTAGLVLLVSGTTGALLVVLKPIDRWANAALFRVPPAATAAPIASMLDRLQASCTASCWPRKAAARCSRRPRSATPSSSASA